MGTMDATGDRHRLLSRTRYLVIMVTRSATDSSGHSDVTQKLCVLSLDSMLSPERSTDDTSEY